MQDIKILLDSIYKTESDKLLESWGYNLAVEYYEILSHATLDTHQPILELATGTGRMSAVLTRLGYDVITGDVSTENRKNAELRITEEHLHKVKLLTIDMESLPFDDDSFSSVISMNTFHHLEHPEVCIRELIRVHSGKNSLIIGDFNKTGFAELQKIHRILYAKDHTRGNLSMDKLKPLLDTEYHEVKEIHTPLNVTLIASAKKKK
ncbi:MAG: class I SAM-dependent methyltransferase [Bacteroidota bacterium]|nr:class I SAM-dependent methyltransferase [Bacteroidota bacterium]